MFATTTTPANPTLQHFTLDDMAMYTAEQGFGPTASPDFRVFTRKIMTDCGRRRHELST
jgi:hypothetical protein